MNSIIKDIALAPSGRNKIEWVKNNMPILAEIEKEFEVTKPFAGRHMLVSVHIEAKTARFIQLLARSGATVVACGCNPLSTQDDVAAALSETPGVTVFAKYGITEDEYNDFIDKALETNPQIIVDDGGDIVSRIHNAHSRLIPNIIGGCEETTTGIIRLKAMTESGELKFPMFSVNDAYCKYLFDNRYGTGQSVWNGINRTTNLIVAGKYTVIAGYGWCGKGCAMRAKALGAKVIVCEIDPIKAIEAIMDGYEVMPMAEAAKLGDIFVTVTGCENVITKDHFKSMKNGVILSNAGHFDVEINLRDLSSLAVEKKISRENITTYILDDGRRINVLAEGRLVNLAAGDGHPAEIMDMSFAVQALSAQYLVENHKNLENKLYSVPESIDKKIAGIKLGSMGVAIDKLTPEQKAYLNIKD
ncbi:MAG: adenosylhomocysteinase [Monoglobales bacterium]